MTRKPFFTRAEITLWSLSVALIVAAFLLFDRESYLTLAASLIGVTSLILNAKGHPVGQVLMILFSLLYGILSYALSYYGEMITYWGMTLPMAILSLISWLRHPYQGNRTEVEVRALSRRELVLMLGVAAGVTLLFYFVLIHFHTANLLPSTVSVTTSFLAVYLTFRRSPLYALAYAANDAVLILLWSLAAATQIRYLSVTVCFTAFLINDLYGYINWERMRKRQSTPCVLSATDEADV